jgi:NAD(P)-dependent dehydrogenase (short-subunit alcohol dehydrogenase family)
LRSGVTSSMAFHMPLSVVTGANRGIGLALATLLAKRGDAVIGVCRSSSKELEATGAEVLHGVDLTDDEGLARLHTAIGERQIDLLINNAGILIWGDGLQNLDVEGIRTQFEVNALAPLRVTAMLRPALRKGGKVALITSRMGSIGDNSSGGAYGYRMSKAALNMAGKSLAEDLKPDGIAVAILHPGMVKTDMARGHGQVEPMDAAKGLLARIDALSIQNTGGFWHQNGEQLPW